MMQSEYLQEIGQFLERGPSRIRTGDGGFAIRCHVSPCDEIPSTSTGDMVLFAPGLRENQKPKTNSPDVQRILDAWPTLPEALRASILAMIEAAAK
jgi:hypothetical protein